MFSSAPLPPLRHPRIHEAQGPGALTFALHKAAREGGRGPVLLIQPAHRSERLLPGGLAGFLPPERLIEVTTPTERDQLWAIEEVLRAGAAGFVLAWTGRALTLTEGRRLQLAAEAGRTSGILLTPEGAGCNAAETRWHCAPTWGRAHLDPKGDSTLASWSLIKNKMGTCESWQVRIAAKTGSVSVVSPPGERPLGAAAAGGPGRG